MSKKNNYTFFILHSTLLILHCTLLILFSSCGRDNSHDEDLKIFKYNESAGILTLDPIYAKDLPHIWACNQIFNGLVAFDDEMNVVPAIAKSWKISDDGMTYTFILRDDVYFHEDTCFAVKSTRQQDNKTTSRDALNASTRKVVAEDFVYSFNRVLDRKLNSSGSWIFANVEKRHQVAESPSHQDLEPELVEGTTKYAFYALNDTILKIELTQPFPAFLGILSMTYASVVPHEAVDFYGTEFGRHPVGTGPFKYQYWKEGVKLVFRKNPNYFEFEETIIHQDNEIISQQVTKSPSQKVTQRFGDSGTQRLPYIDAVSISFIIDKQVAFMEFVKGKFDFMSGIDARYKDELLTRDGQLRQEYEDDIYLIREPYLNTEYLAFFLGENDTLGRERSLALRQAVSYSIDREKMLRYLRNGIGTPGNYGIIPVGLPGALVKTHGRVSLHENAESNIGYPYNPKKAERLLKDNDLLGYELKLYTTQDYIDIAKFVQSALTEIGLNCKVEEMMPAALREKRANGNLPFFRSSWVADYPDAENYLSLFTTNNFTPQGPNYTHYSNAKFDELYQKSLTCNDIEERARIYHEMDSLMMTEAPVVILFYDEVLRFVNKNVEGLGSNPTNMLNLKKVKIN